MAATGWAAIVQVSGPVPAQRLIIQYRAGNFHLLSRIALLKVLPPSDDLPASNKSLSGFWFEVQSPDGAVRYRRIIADPITAYTEVPDPAQVPPQPERAEIVPAETVFTLLIPQVLGSNQLVLVSTPLGSADKSRAAQVLARIPLAEEAK